MTPEAALWAMAHLATPMAIRVAATLRIADHLTAHARTGAELAELTGTDRDALDRVLRHLAGKGVLDRDDTGRYALTPVGAALASGHPAGMRDMLDIDGTVGRAELAFVQLLHCVRTGDAGYPAQFGTDFWADLAAHPERSAGFDRRMGADIAVRGPDIVAGYDWSSLRCVVDVGGGDGSLLIQLLRRFPGLRGTVVDLPDTADLARRALAAAGLADRATAVGGSFFDSLPRDADAYVLSSVLHNWNDERAVAILRRCADAAGPDGRVLVIERIGADGESTGTAMDLRMLVYYGGRERRAAELAALADAAGLRVAATHGAGMLSIVELVP
jgi:hypothetical protein